MKAVAASALALALVVCVQVCAEDKKAAHEVEVVKDLAYYEGADADKVRHKLDLYLPKGQKDYPVLFFIHGGGWQRGSKNGSGGLGKTLAKNGIGMVTINYRLTPAV
jgi:acetyl esterase/lipase